MVLGEASHLGDGVVAVHGDDTVHDVTMALVDRWYEAVGDTFDSVKSSVAKMCIRDSGL